MTRKIGKIILKLFLFLVVVTAVTLSLLFARGLRFSPQEGEFIHTGILDISSTPNNAAIFIDDKFYGFTSQFLRGVPINSVNIRIEKGGYNTWKKNVNVDSEIITKIKPVLITKNPDYYIRDIAEAKNVLIDPEKRGLVIYNSELKIIRAIDFVQEKESILELTESVDRVFFSKEGALMAAFDKKNINLEIFKDKKDLPPEPYANDKYNISPDGKFLLIIRGNDLWKYEIKSGQSILVKRFNEKIFDVFWIENSESILVIKNKVINIVDSDGSNELSLLNKDEESEVYFLENIHKIIFKQNNIWKQFIFSEN